MRSTRRICSDGKLLEAVTPRFSGAGLRTLRPAAPGLVAWWGGAGVGAGAGAGADATLADAARRPLRVGGGIAGSSTAASLLLRRTGNLFAGSTLPDLVLFSFGRAPPRAGLATGALTVPATGVATLGRSVPATGVATFRALRSFGFEGFPGLSGAVTRAPVLPELVVAPRSL